MEEDLDIFDQIDQSILDRNYQLNTDVLLDEDMEMFDCIDPQKLIREAMLESNVVKSQDKSVQPNTAVVDAPLDFQTFLETIENVNTSTQHLSSPIHVTDLSSEEILMLEIAPLLTPACEEEYTVSQILKMFDQ